MSFPLTRRQLLESAAALTAATTLPSWLSASSVDNPQPIPGGPLAAVSVTVTNDTEGSIAPTFAGFSYEKTALSEPLFTPSNTNLIAIFKRLGPSVLRIGGNLVDLNVWAPDGPGQTKGHIAPSDVDALAGFLRAAGWQCLYAINLGGAASGATTPALAAAEVAYAAQRLGPSLLGIEIGNECDLFGGEPGHFFEGNWSLEKFIALWRQYRAAILAVTPNVAITGPASAGNVTKWTVPFAQTVGNEISLLTQHYYRANGDSPTSTAEFLVTPDPRLLAQCAQLTAAAKPIGIPWRMSECNSYYHGGAAGVSDSYASSLWVIDFLFNCAQGGASGVNLHTGGNGPGYTPIADKSGTVVETRPEFYGILLFTLAGLGDLQKLKLDAGSLNVTAYALKSDTEGLHLVVVNKDLTKNLQLTAKVPHSASSASLLILTQSSGGAAAPDLMAKSGVTLQGAVVNADASFAPAPAYTAKIKGAQLTCFVPALSAVLIRIA
jgi:hypothetical protein